MNVQTKHPFVDITNRLNYKEKSNKKQTNNGYDTLSKYTRSVNQQSERTKNTLKFMAVSREPSLIFSPIKNTSTQQDIYTDNYNMDEETLTVDKNDEIICTEEIKVETENVMKKSLEIKRMPTINSLPSFSFSYSFADSSIENMPVKNKISKEKVILFKQKLREARRKFVMKEMLLKAENMDKHSELSITAAESLLDLTRK